MLRSNIFRIHKQLFRNFWHLNFNRKCPQLNFSSSFNMMKTPVTTFNVRLCRQFALYQFREKKAVYYPDRKLETKRMIDNYKNNTQLVVDRKPKGQPKDFYYRILGVSRNATIQQIKQAFYALAKRFHPDTTQSEQKLKHFQELSNAYTILSDETKRLEYDQLGQVKDEQAFLEQATRPNILQQKLDNKIAEVVSTQRKLDQANKQEDLMKLTTSDPELDLSFVEATCGCKKRADLNYLMKCDTCNGKSQLRVKRDINNEPCRRCNGTGQIVRKTPTFTDTNTCPTCKGKRYINRSDCETCENRGFLLGVVQVLVNVPSGSRSGDIVTIENPNTKQRVNYHLIVHKSDYFQRKGSDVYTEKFLNISEAVLGGTFKVRGLYEEIDIKVPPGTQSHTTIVLKNKGVRTREGIGNHIITLVVRIPRILSTKQRQLVIALSKTEDPVYERSAYAPTT